MINSALPNWSSTKFDDDQEASSAGTVRARNHVIEAQKERFEQLAKAGLQANLSTTAFDPSSGSSLDADCQVINLPKYQPLPGSQTESMAAIQRWEGVVTAVSDDVMHAMLIDVTAGCEQPEEFATIPLSEISPDQLHRVVPGAIFQWVIGIKRSPSMVENSSVIYFRRTRPRRTQQEIPPLFDE